MRDQKKKSKKAQYIEVNPIWNKKNTHKHNTKQNRSQLEYYNLECLPHKKYRKNKQQQ